jgi:hypothetical protein
MTWINQTNVRQVEESLIPRYNRFRDMLNQLTATKNTESVLGRRAMVNNFFNTIDSMLRTILGISQVNRRYKNGAKYLRHVYFAESKQIIREEFT